MAQITRQDRILGALLGVHAGDSLGATMEFQSWTSIRETHPNGLRDIVGGGLFQWPAGHATDDTDLTRAILLAYRDTSRCLYTPTDVAVVAGTYMLDWLDGHWPGRTPGVRPRDAGVATLRGLARFRASRDPARAGAGHGQRGNGSLMRCVPTGALVMDRAARMRDSARLSAITHDDAVCVVACVAYNEMVAVLVEGGSVRRAVEEGVRVARDGCTLSLTELLSQDPRHSQHLVGGGAGYVLDSLLLAVAALNDERPSLEDVLGDVVRVGMDTDSNAAIAGGLLGAMRGMQGIPQRWIERLQFAEEFTEVVTELGRGRGF
ncbi:hypothetical protein TD95_003106 [Thielaviopsis punctulata]|uniref:ADP-ribosylhydrolase ARH3 n=1 Tax=Thielaviopsis punctulata TaxID=72032 RepID=A0A0F4ZH64_9PEZI|nr:hypothetical protein TD95_003106 [Thielaviopsis punctulata]